MSTTKILNPSEDSENDQTGGKNSPTRETLNIEDQLVDTQNIEVKVTSENIRESSAVADEDDDEYDPLRPSPKGWNKPVDQGIAKPSLLDLISKLTQPASSEMQKTSSSAAVND